MPGGDGALGHVEAEAPGLVQKGAQIWPGTPWVEMLGACVRENENGEK